MQLTLVSHYGEKPSEFARLITELQTSVSRCLRSFRCYEPRQVHGTLIGLEGVRMENGIRNENFFRHRGETRPIEFSGLLTFLRHDFHGFEICVGGFEAERDYGFTSRGQHPFVRSFTFQQQMAVAMGWPTRGSAFSSELEEFRRGVQRFGVLHKWHRAPGEIDNDFFFVLGRSEDVIPENTRRDVEQELREQLRAREPLQLPVNRQTISLVAYQDAQLTPASSRIFRLTDADLTPDALAAVYRE
jgi:hypothetical protein